jgi:hypothetical protein
MSIVYKIENRGQRSHIIGIEDRISGGSVNVDAQNKPINVYIEPGQTVVVTESCGKKISETYPNEIKILAKTNRKE